MKYQFYLIIVLLLSVKGVSAQDCGTEVQQEQIDFMESVEYGQTRSNVQKTHGIIDIPIQYHVIRKEDGSGGIEVKILKKAIQQLNDIYIHANIRFIHPAPIHFVDNNSVYQTYIFNVGDEQNLVASWDKPNRLNIYCFPDMRLAGYAYMPQRSKRNRIVLNNIAFTNNSTFAHEIGHFFGLLHTHMAVKDVQTQQYIREPIHREDRNNNGIKDCYEKGDFCCDTPADPNLAGKHAQHLCIETCELKAPILMDGQAYQPQVTNLMSYNPFKNCRVELTKEQLSRVLRFAQEDRQQLRLEKEVKGQTIKGAITFGLKQNKAMPVKLDHANLYRFTNAYSEKDEFTFTINNQNKASLYVSIINMDGLKNKVLKVFPFMEFGDQPIISPNSNLTPFDNNYISLSSLDQENPIKEYTCILLSLAPINIEQIVNTMQQTSGTFTNRLYKVIGEQILPLDRVTYQDGSTIRFNAQMEKEEILPIMVEMEHVSF